jgi:hypothetical protein
MLQIRKARAPEFAILARTSSIHQTLVFPPSMNIIIKPSAFRSPFRFYVSAHDVPKPEEFRNETRDLLNVANRFGCRGDTQASGAHTNKNRITSFIRKHCVTIRFCGHQAFTDGTRYTEYVTMYECKYFRRMLFRRRRR